MKIKAIRFSDKTTYKDPEKEPMEIAMDYQPLPGFVAIRIGSEVNFFRRDEISWFVVDVKEIPCRPKKKPAAISHK
ncbi:hypothetical protein Q5O14_15030 [Eubacteriaceae bacterium ES2]|nr:hypothetical protein Q5O14_15030 [Eubacteriaceae bacterium ES2]